MIKNKRLFTFIGLILLCATLVLSLASCEEIAEDPENVSFYATAAPVDDTCKYLLKITVSSIAEHTLTSFSVGVTYYTADGKSVAVSNITSNQGTEIFGGESREFEHEIDLSEYLSEPAELTVKITPRELTFGTGSAQGGTSGGELAITTTAPGNKVLAVIGIGSAAATFISVILIIIAFAMDVKVLKPIGIILGSFALALTATSFLSYGVGNFWLIASIASALLLVASAVWFFAEFEHSIYRDRTRVMLSSLPFAISFVLVFSFFTVYLAFAAFTVIAVGLSILTVILVILLLNFLDGRSVAIYPLLYITGAACIAALSFFLVSSVGLIFSIAIGFFAVSAAVPWLWRTRFNKLCLAVTMGVAFGLACLFTMLEYLPKHLDAVLFIVGPELFVVSIMMFMQRVIDKRDYDVLQAVSVPLAHISVFMTVLGFLMIPPVNILLALGISFGATVLFGLFAYLFHLIYEKSTAFYSQFLSYRTGVLSYEGSKMLFYSGALCVIGGLILAALFLGLYFVIA